MAKDFTIKPDQEKRMWTIYKWHRDCGDEHQSAADKACRLCKAWNVERLWQRRFLARNSHAVEQRLVLDRILGSMRAHYDQPDPYMDGYYTPTLPTPSKSATTHPKACPKEQNP